MGVFEILKYISYSEFDEKFLEVQNKVIKIYRIITGITEIDWISIFVSSELYNKLQWPPCLDLDKEKKKKILELIKLSDEQNVVKEILGSYDEKILNQMLDRWESYDYLNLSRISILREAINSYIIGNYYSCVVLNTSQYEGITKDIEEYLKTNPQFMQKINKIKEEQKEYLKKNNSKLKSSKINEILENNKHTLERNSIVLFNYITIICNEYINKYIINNKPINSKHPNRHKILHGEDCSFGTKEKALKTILCIDMLMRFYSIMDQRIKID